MPRSATFKSRHRSSRGTSTLYKRLGVSNHFHTLFLISNENLIPTSYTFSEFLSANFRENRKQKPDFEFFSLIRENTQNREQPPKTSPIEQITDRWEPKISNLQRVTLQCLTSCYRWSNLLRDNVSNLALASAKTPPKIWKYAWKILIFLLWFLTCWPPFDIVRLHPIG